MRPRPNPVRKMRIKAESGFKPSVKRNALSSALESVRNKLDTGMGKLGKNYFE